MEILGECQLFMSYAGLSINKFVNIGGKHLPTTIIQTLILSALISFVCIQLTNSVNNITIGLQAMLFPVHCLVLVSIKLVTFIVLMVKNGEIAELIEYLQIVVNQRMFNTNIVDINRVNI